MTTLGIQDIRKKGMAALNSTLGPVGAIRFIQELENGRGDYTRERRKRLAAQSVESIYAEARRVRKTLRKTSK